MRIAERCQIYQTCSDKELIETILAKDLNALYYLVKIKYRKELYGVIGKQLHRILNKYTDIDLEYWLYKFYNYMTVPTKIRKKSKFENITNKNNIQSWLCRCCRNFLLNDAEFQINAIYGFDFDELPEPETQERRQNHITGKFILIIETCNKILSNREKYVVFTYLYCEKKQVDALRYMDKKIADVLNTTEGNVRKIKSAAYSKIRNFLIV
jgi:DNA-directed RNA polymerase specialized sigma24 family protein